MSILDGSSLACGIFLRREFARLRHHSLSVGDADSEAASDAANTLKDGQQMVRQMEQIYRTVDGGTSVDTPEHRQSFSTFVARSDGFTVRDLRDRNARSTSAAAGIGAAGAAAECGALPPPGVQQALLEYTAAMSAAVSTASEEQLSWSVSDFFDPSRTGALCMREIEAATSAYLRATHAETRIASAKASAGRARPAFTEAVVASERRHKHPFLSQETGEHLLHAVSESRGPDRLRFMVWDTLGLYSGMFATLTRHPEYTTGTRWVVLLDVLGKPIAVAKHSLIAVPNVCDTSRRVCGFCDVDLSNDDELDHSAAGPAAGWCSTCKSTFYCCREHQKKHFRQHGAKCKMSQLLGYHYNPAKFDCPEIEAAARSSLLSSASTASIDLLCSSGDAGHIKVRAQALNSLLKSYTATVSEKAILASTSPEEAAEYRGLIYMQICQCYHKMAACCLCLGLYEQAHRMLDRANHFYTKPERLELSPALQQEQFQGEWKHLTRDVLLQQRWAEVKHTSHQLRQARDKTNSASFSRTGTVSCTNIEGDRVMRQTVGGQLQNALSHLIYLLSLEDKEIVVRFNVAFKLMALAIDYNLEFDNRSFNLDYLVAEAARMSIYPAMHATEALKKNTNVKMDALRQYLLPASNLHKVVRSSGLPYDDDQLLFVCHHFSMPFEVTVPRLTPADRDGLMHAVKRVRNAKQPDLTAGCAINRLAIILYIRQVSELADGDHMSPEDAQGCHDYIRSLRSFLAKMDNLKLQEILPYHAERERAIPPPPPPTYKPNVLARKKVCAPQPK